MTDEVVDEGGEFASAPPDVSDALSQMNQSVEQRFDATGGEEPYEPGDELGGYEDELEPGYEPEGEVGQPADEDGLAHFIGEKVQEEVGYHREIDRRWDGILELGEEFPELNSREIGGAVRDLLEQLGQIPGNGIPPDPVHVELAYKALKADQIAANETSPEQVSQRPGATLETGAGPGAPEPEVDPVTQAYMKALGGADTGYDGLDGDLGSRPVAPHRLRPNR